MIGQYVTVHGDVISHVNISHVMVEDGGEYSCMAENRAGKVTHAARLNVYGKFYTKFNNQNSYCLTNWCPLIKFLYLIIYIWV